ncbi:MAG: alpha-2-macroglobulin family protein [Hyphomicrobiales bacterium]
MPFAPRLSALLCLLLLTFVLPAHAADRRAVTVPDSDYFGADLRVEQNTTLKACEASCLKDKACKAFTFNGKGWCFLKSSVGELKSFKGATAGKIVEPDAAAAQPATPAKPAEADIGEAPALDFVPSYIADEANQYADEAEKRSGQQTMEGEALIAQGDQQLAAGDARAAADSYRGAVSLIQDQPGPWINLARAALAIPPADGNEQYNLPREASSAAMMGFAQTRTASSRAEALAVLAQALERRELWRPALESYKASLALADSAPVRQAFLDLKSRKGFRVVSNSVDADNSSPRMCVQFSDDLVASGVDYQNFVTLDDKPAPAIRAEGQQICVDGLQHGNRYRIGLRQGLPAAVGEVLEAPVNLDVYVRDRAPSVRFTGNNFVLPKVGAKGIPLVTVNAKEVDLTLYRISDRNLSRIISEGRFLQQIDSYEASMIPDQTGEQVWKGVIETGVDLNKEVLTLFPVDEALPERKPGVYVMTAAARNAKTDEWAVKATQWFVVSNVGLATYAGNDGLHVYARALDTAKPLANVAVDLVARNNEVLAKASTNASGEIVFDAGLVRGPAGLAPAALLATGPDQDFVFLNLAKPGFDLSDRGVTGRASPGPVDVFLYTERGIYRAGETVNVSALARDDSARAVTDLPLTIVFVRPDGVEFIREVSRDKGFGGHWVTLDLPRNAIRGTWTVQAFTDPKANPVVEKQFLVEDFTPDRIEFDLTLSSGLLTDEKPATAEIAGRFLYGAPASDLSVEGEVRIASKRTMDAFPGYQFGLADEQAVSVSQPLEDLPSTDEQGKASFDVALDEIPFATQPLQATVIARLREGGGRAVERTASVAIGSTTPFIGIKPGFDGDSVGRGATTDFQVIAANPDGTRAALKGLKWTLSKVERQYQWYRTDGNWNYEPIVSSQRVDAGEVDVGADMPAKITAASLDWGRYRLEVESPDQDGPRSSVEFTAGWYVDQVSTETPDGLEVALDKAEYAPGETAKLKIAPQYDGEAQIIVGTDRVQWQTMTPVSAKGTTIDIPVSADYGAGAYVTVAVYRPGSNADSRMPARALGLRWLKVAPGARNLSVSFDVPEKQEPRSALKIPVSVSLPQGTSEAYVAVAAVDVGILNLTRYTPPDPAGWYFGQRRLGLDIHDLYGNLIDGTQGVIGKIRNGGDQAGMGMEGSPPTEELVAFFSGPVKLDPAGKATISFDIPEFNGTVRLMAVAWSKDGVGSGAQDVVVRDPIVVTATLPKAMAPGDASTLRLDIANTDAPDGDYQLTLDAPEQVKIQAKDVPASVTLAKGKRTAVAVPIVAAETGEGILTVRLASATGPAVERTQGVVVRPAQLPVTDRKTVTLPPGGSITVDKDFLAGKLSEGAEVSVAVSRSAGLDAPALLMQLDRYPYGCAEQTTSKALPLLYLSEVARESGMDAGPEVKKRVQEAIERVLSYQAASGSFGLWSPGSGDLWLDAYVTDFLTRARELKYDVPDEAFGLALDNLQNSLSFDASLQDQGAQMAYALYVLARNKRASMGDLRYFVDARLDEFPTVMARAQLAAALALYGDKERADKGYASAFSLLKSKQAFNWSRNDYGTPLRDGAALLALAAETRPAVASVPEMVSFVSKVGGATKYMSTQEQAWLLLAARALKADDQAILLDVNGQSHAGRYAARLDAQSIAATPIALTNTGKDPVEVVVTTRGAPAEWMPPTANGFTIERKYYTLDGEEADPSVVAQNTRLLVVVKVNQNDAWPARVLITDLLPGGFEIENPKLVQSADLAAFDWLPEITAAHTEARSDRFVAAFDRMPEDEREFTFAYLVRAVSPGVYTQPAAAVEDMYRPQLFARTGMGKVEVLGPKP